jgi:biotin carboxyl carrier protein
MDQVQVQKATEDLISERDHLNAEAPPSKPAASAADQAAAATVKKPAHKAPAQRAATAASATTASAQGAGMIGAGMVGAQGSAGADLKP